MTDIIRFIRRALCRHKFQWSRRYGNTLTCRKCGHRERASNV